MADAKRARYTLEFKMEAVRLVRGGQAAAVTVDLPRFHGQFRDS
jgi:hypothetical protein